MPTKCWDCKYLGKCQICVPCDKFEDYGYNTKYPFRKIAQMLGVSDRTLYRWLHDSKPKTLRIIKNKLGLDLDWIKYEGEYSHFIDKRR